jgi:EAL domain-containing protein (putative c-di-GMP-specific phosphodiesterase class I)
MKTIAEYVQGGPTLALLAELGIDLAQGYFIGRPTSVPTTKSMPIPINLRQLQASKKLGSNDGIS